MADESNGATADSFTVVIEMTKIRQPSGNWQMSRDIIVPKGDEALYDRFHFAQAARASCGLVVCSGQIGTDASGGVPEDPAEEFRNAWRAVERVLKAADLSLDDVLEYTTFHVGLQEHLATFMSVRDEFLSAPWPAWSAIGVSELAVAGGRCEIRVVAQAK